MGIFSPSFLFGLVILLYLASFVVFAILRIATGISIQRLGYFSLRRIAYTPRDGVRIDVRGLGLHLHRPTFAQPTWVSLRLTELKVTVNIKVLGASAKSENVTTPTASDASKGLPSTNSHRPILRGTDRSRAWKNLTRTKERLKHLHEKINWLRMVDVVAENSSLIITDVGRIEVGTLTMVVDTRRKTVDRGRLFQHKKLPARDQRPAEWMFTIKGALFTPEGKHSLEVIDICGLNIHGLLYKDLAGLRDTSIALKLGRIHIPYDDLMECHHRIKEAQQVSRQERSDSQLEGISLSDVIEELDRPGSREANIVQTVSDSKEFVSSILRGIQEIQMAVSFVGMTKCFHSIQPAGSPLYLNVSMNEFGIDMHRLDQRSPAHRMYFSSKDIAHQALLAAISIGVSVDNGHEKPERLLYIPMATTTVKTTLPSKTVAFSEDKNAAERNANILFANLVVTSPSVDVDPKHLPMLLALTHSRDGTNMKARSERVQSQHLLSRLLPKANIKVSIHEPVIRVTLPTADTKLKDTDEYDLLICAVSSISVDVESSHSAAGELHYALTSSLRISSHQFYYHTASGESFNLLLLDALELKAQVTASPDVCVVASGNIQTLSIHMVRPEISAGVRQIFQQLTKSNQARTTKLLKRSSSHSDFLRPLPTWLVQFSLQGSNFGVEIAGVDCEVSEDTRGIALQLESWTAEYRLQKAAPDERPSSRRRSTKKSTVSSEPQIMITPPSEQTKAKADDTDGRRLAIHVRGLEGFVVEGIDVVEPESFLSLPRFEVAFTTTSDTEGPIFHLNSYTKALYMHYSLYRYYAFGVATAVLRKAFVIDEQIEKVSGHDSDERDSTEKFQEGVKAEPLRQSQLMTVDVRAELLQVKAKMPSDPPMMLQVYGMETGRHRWAKPFMRSKLVRLYAEAPQTRSVWARIASIKSLRVDLREVRKKRGGQLIEERSFDVGTEFIRLAVPHQLVMHKIFDNIVNAMKATQQLHHRFKTGTDEYILKKRPEQPKSVPRISIRSKAFLFDIEDGPFDWKLGTIYRVGLVEQKQRLAREEAFFAKAKELEGLRHQRGSSRYRTTSAQVKQRDSSQQSTRDETGGRTEGINNHARRRSESPRSHRSRNLRYNPKGKCALSGEARISTEQAWQRVQKHNAQSWKRRIDGAYQVQTEGMRKIRGIFWGSDDMPNEEGNETILAMPERPGLMSTLISDLHIVIDKPSFPIKEYPQFLHRVGKGMPLDMEYSLLIPLNLQVEMGEARVTLRDYPLPLLHVPSIRPGQSPRLPSWSLRTDFVIAEEYRGAISTKQIKVEVVSPDKFANLDQGNSFAIDVRRTVSPVKTYSDVEVAINTSAPTSITWGTSLQPAIQEMMMIIEGFTKPQVDPSDRCGFWDKIRLSFHSRVNVVWKGDGDVHLNLKGKRASARTSYLSLTLFRLSGPVYSHRPWCWFCDGLAPRCTLGSTS